MLQVDALMIFRLHTCTCSSALEIIKPYFIELLEEQDFFGTPEQWKKVLALVPKKVAVELNREWTETPMSSLDKWRRLRNEVKVWYSMRWKQALTKMRARHSHYCRYASSFQLM